MADNIKHVVLLMLENRSFDHMLGDCAGVEGVASQTNQPHQNSYGGNTYEQKPGAGRFVNPDPHHELEHVAVQLSNNNGGFVQDYAVSYPNAGDEAWREIMRYHQHGFLKALHALADNFTVCDHWYASVPGPTWPNRLFAMSGTSLGRVSMPEGYLPTHLHWYDQPTIFDRLNEKGRTWNVYYHDFALSFLLVNQREPRNVARHHHMSDFYRDAASTDQDVFPDFAFIEPAYFAPNPSDDHPPHDVFGGETLIANVYNAIRSNAQLWHNTLLVVLFDEHGGFYDHVPPPYGATPPDHHNEEYSFLQYGVRVPAILVSPWVKKDVCKTRFDHTSLLRYMTDKWELGALGERTHNAASIAECIAEEPRAEDDTPIFIQSSTPEAGVVAAPEPQLASLTGNQKSMLSLSHLLEDEAGEDAQVIAARSRQLLNGPHAQIDVACDRVDSFVKKVGSKTP